MDKKTFMNSNVVVDFRLPKDLLKRIVEARFSSDSVTVQQDRYRPADIFSAYCERLSSLNGLGANRYCFIDKSGDFTEILDSISDMNGVSLLHSLELNFEHIIT
ncbi:MAG: hypothetical protein AAFY98_12420, partial [Verrucomicrobiota bacterium]